GWDVHKAIVDNLHANTRDEAHAAFAMPAYMQTLIDKGVLGDKSGGGFFTKGAPFDGRQADVPEVARRMSALHRVGRYQQAIDLFAEAGGIDAERMRKVILGYVSYGLKRVGEVVETFTDVDRIMGFG